MQTQEVLQVELEKSYKVTIAAIFIVDDGEDAEDAKDIAIDLLNGSFTNAAEWSIEAEEIDW